MKGARSLYPGALVAMIPVLLVAVGIVAAGVLLSQKSGDGGPSGPALSAPDETAASVAFPRYVMEAPGRVQAAYLFALDRPDVTKWMPCYCGCGDHDGHQSVHDCFISRRATEGLEFDKHGANCDVCVGIVLDSKTLWEEGYSLRTIRAFIDDKYGDIGPRTDTPLPPE
jgi:hypothetical protein